MPQRTRQKPFASSSVYSETIRIHSCMYSQADQRDQRCQPRHLVLAVSILFVGAVRIGQLVGHNKPKCGIVCGGMVMKSILALLTVALSISFAAGCSSKQPAIASGGNSSPTAGQANVSQTQLRNWGQPFSCLRSSIDIEPAVADDTSPRLLSLTFQNSSGAELSFKPFIALHLTGASDDNSFWAPADITMPKSNFPKRGFPQPPNGQPMISLAPGESRTLSFPLEDLGWIIH